MHDVDVCFYAEMSFPLSYITSATLETSLSSWIIYNWNSCLSAFLWLCLFSLLKSVFEYFYLYKIIFL
jgi:hypothetical protein